MKNSKNIIKDELINLSEGNPGALTCLIGLMNLLSSEISDEKKIEIGCIFSRLKQIDIKGENIYVLWNDLSKRDYSTMANICKACPDDILLDACSRQDYSGVDLVADYL
tara:strand:- start:982 stop:1308 length:327 start_codon:yes stop_codon:yes gene_type:complete